MRILLDEGVPKPLRKHLSQHVVHTVPEQGWDSIQNGKLLNLVEQEGYEVFLTADKNMSYQQAFEGRRFGILVLSTNHWPTVSRHTEAVADAVNTIIPGQVIEVDCGYYPPSKMHPSSDK